MPSPDAVARFVMAPRPVSRRRLLVRPSKGFPGVSHAASVSFASVSLAAASLVAVSFVCGCEPRSLGLHEDVTDPSAPTSATFQLAPAAPGSAPPPSPADNVLAATAPDATPPNAASAPPPGTLSPTCVKGWSTPGRGSPLRGAALDMMRVRPGERFVVEEMRYFVGPEDAEVLGLRGDVERWYVKASTETEPRRRQRWLVRRAKIGSGVDAIAPFESTGYGPGVWHRPDANDPSLADPFERPCQGTKPGDRCMGLPREVLGCLAGT
jgi:hypothetical protein